MADKKVNKLKKQRSHLKGVLTKFSNFLAESGNTASIHELISRLERAEGTLEKFCDITLELEDVDDQTDYTEENDQFENDYYRIVGLGKEKLEKRREIKPTILANEVNEVINVRLPTIDLPIFDGAYDEWFQFKDTFNALIENNKNLSEVQKYYYLNSCLKGKAKQILCSLEISGNNYGLAWELLTKRYENTRIITNAHVQAIFELPNVSKENFGAIRNLVDEFLKHKGALEAMKHPVKHWDILLVHIIATKLDSNTRKSWEERSKAEEELKIDKLIEFLNEKCRILETINREKVGVSTKLVANANAAVFTSICPYCRGDHMIYKCNDFLKLSINERINKIKNLGLCWNCLRKGHTARDCRFDKCSICRRSHNKLIHVDINKREERVAAHCQAEEGQVMLTTAIINLKNKYGKIVRARAMLDVGSNANFITREMFKRLKIKDKEKVLVAVTGMGCSVSSVNERVQLEVGSIYNDFKATMKFLMIDRITTKIPTIKIETKQIKLPNNIKLADPEFGTPGEIDVLLGAEIFYELLTNERKETGIHGPVLQGSRLGWLVTGTVGRNRKEIAISNLAVGMDAVRQEMEKFWKIEEVENLEVNSQMKRNCELNFVNTVDRANDGKFIVHLPKKNDVTIGNTKQMALKRFYNLERRLDKNEVLKRDYVKFMKEYEELSHMEQLRDEEVPGEACYIPHHPIYKDTSSTTKLRIVFDASAKSSNGNSLNDMLTLWVLNYLKSIIHLKRI